MELNCIQDEKNSTVAVEHKLVRIEGKLNAYKSKSETLEDDVLSMREQSQKEIKQLQTKLIENEKKLSMKTSTRVDELTAYIKNMETTLKEARKGIKNKTDEVLHVQEERSSIASKLKKS